MAINLNVNGNTAPLEAAVQAAVTRIRRTPIKITVDDKGATQPLGNMKRGADEFSKSMEAANARIIAFGASMAIINGVSDAFKAMVKNVVEVEKSLADINVVMGLSTNNLDKFSSSLFKVAKETGAAFNVAAEAATEYARQGLAVEETLKRTQDALILTRLTGMDSANAVKALTAAMNTYGDQIKDTTQLVSKFAAVDVKFAVSAEDFADAISRTGQAAKSAGVDIDELVGLVTAAQQKTARGGKVIGNSFKTIFTRIGRTDTLNQLENLGIAVRDVEGKTIGAKRILTDLANTFDHLSEAQKAQIAQTVGGVFQINVLKAVLSDAAKQNGILANATQISAGATDEAITKNEQLRQTMAAMATETGLALKEMSASVGELMLAPGMEKILNIVKSVAEGANDMLGGGESSGNSFAKGFLKGVGNIITGPGLVVIVAVFTKLLVKAVQYARESLTSLIGVTSEAQKQKAIQTSLVNLFGQNAALNKEMLRTDISRTEKEKIILGLLKAQVVEANLLNTVAKSSASNLYRQGYGANLAPRKGRAGGHIPNFANPERAQAAQGGYAAGSIRSMNMPGEGSVIYNSAETVKNFAGFKQPAIMPPSSSKAGKNYQQAFGSIHGFDPYAAGGYVPNYAKSGGRSAKSGGRSIINKDKKMVVFAASLDADRGGKYAGINDDLNNIFSIKPKGKGFAHSSDPAASGFSSVNVPYFGIGKKDAQIDQHKDFQSLINTRLIDAGEKVAGEISTKIFGKNYTVRDLKEGDVAAASGNIFEAAIMALQDGIAQEARKKDPGGTALLDIPRAGRDLLWEVFGAKGFGGLGAEAKIALGGAGKIGSHLKSAAEKFYKIERKGADPFAVKKTNTSKTSDLRKGVLSRKDGLLFVNNEPWSSYNKDQTTLLKGEGFTASPQSGKFSRRGLNSQLKAYGHIPNFANPLSDAIGREKEAGVPVSKIRIGSHSSLMNKSNPIGLGVTNTDDEPNGLKDVFGAANGFVPNYAEPGFQRADVSIRGRRKQDKLVEKLNRRLEAYIAKFKKGEITQGQLNDGITRLSRRTKDQASVSERVTKASNGSIGYIDRLNAARKRATKSVGGGIGGIAGGIAGGIKKADSWFGGTGAGRALGSNAGQMGLMMGLPMAAGFAGDAVTSLSGSKEIGGATSGLLSGAGSGAAMGMMFGPLGTAIGATVGGLYGLVDGLDKAREAANAKAKAERENSVREGGLLGDQLAALFKGYTPSTETGLNREHLSGLRTNEKGFGLIGGRRSSTYKHLKSKLEKEFEKELEGFGKNTSTSLTSSKFNQNFKNSRFAGQGESVALIEKYQRSNNPLYRDRRLTGEEGKQISKDASMDQMIAAEASGLRKRVLVELLKNMASSSPDARIKTKSLEDFEGRDKAMIKKDEDYSFSPGELLKQVEKVKDISLIGGAYNAAESKSRELGDLKDQEIAAIILQLDLQKVQVAAQQAAAMNQLKIKDKYSKIADNLSFEQKIMGSFATDLQKSQNKYLTSMNKANEALALSEAKADEALRSDVLGKLKTGQYSGIEMELKKKLFGESAGERTDQDVTNAMATKSGQELLTILQKIGQEHKENAGTRELINKLVDSSIVKQKNELEIANKTFTNTEGRVKKEKVINDILGGRAEIIKDLERKNRMSSEGLRSSQKIRGFTEQVAAAKRLNAVGPGYQTGREGESFAMSEKRFKLESKITTLEENRGKTLAGLGADKLGYEMENQRLAYLDRKTYGGDDFSHEDIEEYKALVASTEERRKKLDEIEAKIKNINAETKEEIESAKTLLDLEKQRLEEKRKHETGPGSMLNGARDAQKRIFDQAEKMEHRLGGELTNQFRNGLVDGMQAAINKADDLSDVMNNIAMNFLGAIQQAYLGKAADAIVGALPFSSGGGVRKYSKGGGVPAMVTNGEYVMGKEAVNRYGGGFMHRLNAGGKLPGYSTGGGPKPGSALAANFGGGEGYATGRRYQSQPMSGFFYSGRAKNVGLQEDTQYTKGIIQERMRKEAEKKAKKRALMQMIVGTALSVGIGSLVSSGISSLSESGALGENAMLDSWGKSSGIDSAKVGQTMSETGMSRTQAMGVNQNFQNDYDFGSLVGEQYSSAYRTAYRGGKINGYANGGHIAGKSGIDQIPAMLSEGEYVIRASSARQLGKPMLDQINAGKFNEGGAVTPLIENSETGTSGGSTNNINITVNMSGGKGKSEEKESSGEGGTNPVDSAKDEEKSNALAGRLKEQIITTIMEEQRPGGLLSG